MSRALTIVPANSFRFVRILGANFANDNFFCMRGMLAFVSIIMGVGLSATGNVFASSLATMFPAVFLSTMVGLWISHEVHLIIDQFTYYLPATSHLKYSGCSSVRCRRPNHVWLFIGSMVSKKYVISGLGSFFLFTFLFYLSYAIIFLFTSLALPATTASTVASIAIAYFRYLLQTLNP